MNDGYALLRAIEANPDEDTPRLAYADWLDEHATTDADRARAELIRVQCELARTPRGTRRGILSTREDQLRKKHEKAWNAKHSAKLPRETAYARGFIFPRLSAAEFAAQGTALAAVTPLNHLWLTSAAKAVNAVAACPALRYVRHFTLYGNRLRDHHLPALANSMHLAALRTLDLGHNSLGPAACTVLVNSVALTSLEALVLNANPIQDAGLEALTSAAWFPNLVALRVSMCGISDKAVVRLAAMPQVFRLRSLAVGWPAGGDAIARAILDSPYFTNLRRLWLWSNDVSPDVLAALQARFGANFNPATDPLD